MNEISQQSTVEGGKLGWLCRLWPRSVVARGYSFVELLVVATILLILASAILPLAKVTMQRQREAEVRRSLRELRTAIDNFKDMVDAGLIGSTDVRAGSEGYPPDLETLVEGVSVVNDASGRKLKFLRRIPIDPLTGDTEWGLRAYQDRPDSTTWGGAKRLRRLHDCQRYRARRNQISGLVAHENARRTANQARHLGLDPHRTDHRHLDHYHSGGHRPRGLSQRDSRALKKPS